MSITEDVQAPKVPANFAEAQQVLAASLPNYTRRTHQIAMAEEIERIIADESHGLVQGGTGIGKSLAHLIPHILSGQRVVVATATKALQAQYSGKDLPFLEQYLGVPFTWSVIKGRANYQCHAKIEELEDSGAYLTAGQRAVIARTKELSTPEAARDLILSDREDFPTLTEAEWQPFSMSSEECPGADHCPFGQVCLAERAKAKAAESQVIITNTAYLLRDLRLRDETEGHVQLLGAVDRIVIDEAHTLPEVATGALETTIGDGMIIKLGRDMAAYMARRELNSMLAEMIEPTVNALWSEVSIRYVNWVADLNRGKNDPMKLTQIVLMNELGPLFLSVVRAISDARAEINSSLGRDEKEKLARTRLLRRSAKILDQIDRYLMSPESETVRWAELQVRMTKNGQRENIRLCSAPISVGPFLRRVLWDSIPTILLSATLANGDDFSFMREMVGLRNGEASEYIAGSPFNYQEQAMLFIPDADRPAPNTNPGEWRSFSQACTKYLVTQSKGGALLLFTSRSGMESAYQSMAEEFRAQGLHVMKQGDSTTSELVRVMKEDGNAVLFALRTFFEGIDIQGSALRLVVIDKLPFTPPTDLVHAARGELVKKMHPRDRFADFDFLAVPQMALVLTQAFGRLIRHRTDFGVVAILDPRLTSKNYGRKIVSKLPPAVRTTDPKAAAGFLAKHAG
jgi:ATP-dependent DNA helicase DinG